MFLPTTNKPENIKTATELLLDLGLKDFRFSGYSDVFGISVYFKTDEDLKIRVSDHGVSSTHRMQSEILFSFDAKTFKRGGGIGFKDNQKYNKIAATKLYKIV